MESPVKMSVKSKNLFNFPPQGSYDTDLAEDMARKKQMFGSEDVTLKESNSEETNTRILRRIMKVTFDQVSELAHYKEMLDSLSLRR